MKKSPLSGIKRPSKNQAKSNADRQAEFVAKRSELGKIPAPKDPARRESCRLHLLRFGLTYCLGKVAGFILKKKPSPMMNEYITALQSSYLENTLVHAVLPRGKGKTAWLKVGNIWAASYGHKKFMFLGAANQPNADAILDDIWDFLEECDPYGDDFPEIAIPVRSLEGRMQRCPVQTVDGVRTKIKRAKDRIYFPRIEGSPSSGAIFASRGWESGVRGLVKGSVRPDHIGIDDPQTRKSAKSSDVTSDIVKWVQGDVLGLAGHDSSIGGCMTTTPIYAGDVSEQYKDADLHPEWTTIIFPLVIEWPARMDLWDAYLEQRRRDEIKRVVNFKNATALYRAHREDMDKGAVLLDDSDRDSKTELSALQHAFNLLFKVKREAFDAEYQLTPHRSEAAFQIDAKTVSANISLTKRMVLPAGFHAAVAFVDCMSKDALRWIVLGVGPSRKACVIGYGRYPESGALFPPNAPTPLQNKSFSVALGNLITLIGDMQIKSDNGIIKVSGIAPDRGWKPRIVEWVCTRSKHKNILYPALGFNAQKYAPDRIDGKMRQNVVGVGDHCYLATGKGFRYLGQNVDFWKEYTQRSFLAPALTAGSTAIYGTDPLEHYDFACEIVAEKLADRGIGQNGSEWWKWVMRPGAKNHYLDCTSGALMLASWLRLYDAGQTTASGVNKKRKTRRSRVKLVRGAQ